MAEKLLLLTFCVEQDFFVPVRAGMDEAAKRMGALCEMRGVEGLDNARQIEMLLRAAEGEYDGIAVNIPCMEGFDRALRAVSARVPVVGFNDDVRGAGDSRMAHVSQKLYQAGVTLGQRAAGAIPVGSEILITLHSNDTAALFARRDGMLHALSERHVTAHELVTTTDPALSADMIEAALKKNPNIRAVLATGQADTQGAGLAKSRMGIDAYVCGFDLSDEIRRMIAMKIIDFTIEQQPYAQGFYPVVMLVNYLRHGLIPTDIDAGAIVVGSS